jgi:hypothetical protein
MREADGRRMRTRVKGIPALEKRARALLLAVHRYGRCRAATRAEVLWTARAIDSLTALLERPADRQGDAR